MNKRQMARQMLHFFGPEGEHWIPSGSSAPDNPSCCLLQATLRLFGRDDKIMDREFAKRLGIKRDARTQARIGAWNDKQTWPTIKQLLNSIRDGRQYTGPKAP